MGLFAVYCPSNLATPFLFLDLFEHSAELMSLGFVLGAFISCAFVNAGLVLTIFGARRLKPWVLIALRLLLLVYAFPHMLLISVLAPMSMPDAWIP
ncbi:MAG: hypothetical protein ABUL62_10050 [Myxococcales bacterium]